MQTLCETVQERLLEPERGALTPEQAAHRLACPVCAELARDLDAVQPLLTALAEDVRQRPRSALPAGLAERVRAGAARELSPAAPLSPKPRSAPTSARLGDAWRALLASGSPPVRRLGWACAGLTLLIVGFLGAREWMNQRPVGRLEFAQGRLELRQAGEAREHNGIERVALHREARLRTPDGGGVMMSLGPSEEVRVAVGASSSLTVAARDRIALEAGTVWLEVDPRGRGFAVETRFGTVRVTGTVFGVTVEKDALQVDVTEGTVRIEQSGKEVAVSSGRMLRFGSAALGEPLPRPSGDGFPRWLSELGVAYQSANSASYLPAFATKIKPPEK